MKFSRIAPVKRGAFLREDGMLCMATGWETRPLFPAEDIRIPGKHNIENYLAAVSAVWGEVGIETMHRVAREFGGVEHRIEFVRERNGVKWYNDSIGTSPTRTIAGLDSFDQKVILIAGGYDKHIPYLPLAPKVIEKVSHLILMAQTADKIEAAVRSQPDFSEQKLPIYRVENMQQAVEQADRLAKQGDIVLLSPASASFGMYKNFEYRGIDFKNRVNAL